MSTEEFGKDQVIRALRRLTTAVWALAAIMGVYVVIHLIAYVRTESVYRTFASNASPEPPLFRRPQFKYPNFSDLPLDKQIDAASVIAIARYQREGDRYRCVISEILKLAPGTKFYYAVGDEFHQCSYNATPNEIRGNGQLMFFVGDPAEFRFSTSFDGDRVAGLGDMPIEQLRAKIHSESK